MSTTKSPLRIRLLRKPAFDKLTFAQQRVALAKDVLVRIKAKRITPKRGDLIDHHLMSSGGDWRALSAPALQRTINRHRGCLVCAKGALLTAWIGNFDSFAGTSLGDLNHMALDQGFPAGLRNAFSPRLLAAIEEAFEQQAYDWDVLHLSRDERLALYATFPRGDDHSAYSRTDMVKPAALKSSRKRLITILTNLIKHEGDLVARGEDGTVHTFN